MYSQLSVEKAIAIRAAATIAVIVAIDKVTAEQGIFKTFEGQYKKDKGVKRNSFTITTLRIVSPIQHFVNT